MRPTVVLAAALVAAMPATMPALAQPQGGATMPAPRQVQTDAGPVQVVAVAAGLEHPWGLAFLPDGRMLVTERPGRLRVVTPQGQVSQPLQGVPEVFAQGQGGLLDVVLGPDFASSRRIYLSYAEPGPNGTASTAVARGRLDEGATRLQGVEVIFRQEPKVGGGNHFGSRLAFSPQGPLFVTLGERFKFQPAQDLASDLGKIVRINPDGSIPRDNPFAGRQGARPEIWSYGHRNVQGAAINPATGVLWTHEFGPRGGDELNIPQAGHNYGWPLVSWGRHYNGEPIPDPSTRPDLAGSVRHWTPVISPSGMIFYTGAAFPDWRHNILIGGLTAQGIVRLEVNGDDVTQEHRIPLGRRIRDVEQGPDGAVYALTDGSQGEILRLTPASGGARR
ncbi:PQQ-dependent sugar dehydrogenase [Roseomonas sp. M0104]|uniref:PQQ-dependent sugar dehydrogenase n=1 Tax=Teichococcus coralli TaxID=2545983 RepID=A0A845B977_9PROT|nr:PQQ-dependent sugar dehydrogenase [Pseudoroseomonas coralli]MXP62654.1 PQQ-dependent sugar dehydrogenase [Pseudoroseomonas coralli]